MKFSVTAGEGVTNPLANSQKAHLVAGDLRAGGGLVESWGGCVREQQERAATMLD